MWITGVLLQCFPSVFFLGGLTLFLLIYVISSSSFSTQKYGKEPPGPRPIPLLGNLLQLDLKRPYKALLELSKKYGSVFTIYLGTKKVVILAGYKTVKEALVDHDEVFGERNPMHIVRELTQGHGVVWSNGDSWREMRRFTLTNLRDFGIGKRACEDKIIEECQHLIEVFKKFKGEAFDTTKPINCAVANIICSIIYGSRFEYDDTEFTSLVDRTSRNIKLFGSPSIQIFEMFPSLFKWVADRTEIHEIFAANKKQNQVIFSRLKETLNPQMCRSFVDAFLVRKQNLKVGISVIFQICVQEGLAEAQGEPVHVPAQESGVTNSHFHDDNLMITVMNLFAAGTETTSATLRWGLLLMAKYPKIQDEVQDELRRVIGDQPVQVADRKNLPFTDAVIHETQRLSSIFPTALPHKTTRDITFRGHFIKKGTTVFPLLASVLHDPDEWERPHSFYPGHFLDRNKKFVKPKAFVPFSAGRRICLGEGVARMELFLFFTTLLQRFHFTPAPGVSEDELDLTPTVGFTLSPSPHKLCAVSRM